MAFKLNQSVNDCLARIISDVIDRDVSIKTYQDMMIDGIKIMVSFNVGNHELISDDMSIVDTIQNVFGLRSPSDFSILSLLEMAAMKIEMRSK